MSESDTESSNYEQIKNLLTKMTNVPTLGSNMIIFGGIVPYLITDTDSNRHHSDIDVLVTKDKMPLVRELLKNRGEYSEYMDSLTFVGLDNDFGIKTIIDGIYVEFEPVEITENTLTRRSFSQKRNLAGEEIFTFESFDDLVVPITLGGVQTYSYSPEFMKVQKEFYNETPREKDKKDIEYIESIGINEGKYNKAKISFENKKTNFYQYTPPQNDRQNGHSK
jgi:predicted nucleotidyltransferase